MRSSFWTDEKNEQLRDLHERQRPMRAMARELGCHKEVVRRQIARLGLQDEPKAQALPVTVHPAERLAAFRRARRGFDVPAHLEGRYAELLRAGLSIAAACEQIGIRGRPEPSRAGDENGEGKSRNGEQGA